jgi:hypothetical protein
MATYSELVKMVRDWANRDSSVLPDGVIQSALRYSADEAYRLLEIPPLETSRFYVTKESTPITYCVLTSPGVYTEAVSNKVNNGTLDNNNSNPNVDNVELPVPNDVTSFIYLKTLGTAVRPEVGSTVSGTTITSSNQDNYAVLNSDGTVKLNPHTSFTNVMYNENVGVKDFYDFNDSEPYSNYFTRKGSNLIASGKIDKGTVFELFYYRRLPALDARPNLPLGLTLSEATGNPSLYEVITVNEYNSLTSLEKRTYDLIEGSYVRNVNEVPNWLKDQNEKIVLFGALHRVFDYLQEDQQSEKYKVRFKESIIELNMEERKRKASAGNSYVRFNANGLI